MTRLKFWSRAPAGNLRPGVPSTPVDEVSDDAFEERWYLAANPDVAAAVGRGEHSSGRDHYLRFGLAEGRQGRSAIAKGNPEDPLPEMKRRHEGAYYLTPPDLANLPVRLRRTLVIGTCLAEAWTNCADEQVEHRPAFLLVNRHSVLPTDLPHPAADYDVFIVQLPLRDLLFDSRLWRVAYDDVAGHRAAFDEACAGIDLYVDKICTWAATLGVPVLFGNLLLPQADLTGRLMPRYDLRNGIHFVEELNRALERSLGRFPFAYLLDVDRVAASFGRRYVQDDSVLWATHGSLMPTEWELGTRTEPLAPLDQHYDITWPTAFVAAVWAEVAAMLRTRRQADTIKLVVVDLDDTLWSGISGDMAEIGPAMIEGWPLGVVEALMVLKKRGVLLAIISKNEEARIREIWPRIFTGQITLEDFAAVRINWRTKADNMADILGAVNLLPESTIFIDDNPVERAAMRQAYPTMRVLGRYPFYLRRTLLWSAETQVAAISAESANRTTTVQAKVERDAAARTLDRDAFLHTLDLRVRTTPIGPGDPRFPRAFELLNKTNQFNTTGRRWTGAELAAAVGAGLRVFAFEAEDRFAAYGLIGVCLVAEATVLQFVMSCRVNGLDVELAAMSDILTALAPPGDLAASFTETASNLLCRDFWRRCGFVQVEGRWLLPAGTALGRPAHIG